MSLETPVCEAKWALQTRLNSHTQEQGFLLANSSISQNSHAIVNLSIFTLKAYLQNPIKKQPWKLLFITQLSIKSHRFKDNTGFTTLQTPVNPSTEACWRAYFSILHWTVVGCRWASHHDCWSEQRATAWTAFSADLDSGVSNCPGTRMGTSVDFDKESLIRDLFQAQVWDRCQVA